MDQLLTWDRDLLVFLNNLHTPWLDPIIYYLTKTFASIPLYLYLLFLIYKNYRKSSWIILVGIAITITLSNTITSEVMKPFFMRLRPTHEPGLEGVLHIVKGYKGGLYGFASSHAANTFGTAMFLWLLFRDKYKSITWLFLWAFVLTYTRIYLGVHYPGDVIVGGIIGVLSAWAGFILYKILWKRFSTKPAQA